MCFLEGLHDDLVRAATGKSRRRGALCLVPVLVWVPPRQGPGFSISLAHGWNSGNVKWLGRWVNGWAVSRYMNEEMKRWVGRRMVDRRVNAWADGPVNRWVDGYLLLQGQFLWGSKDRKEEREQVAGLSDHHSLFFSQHRNFSASMSTINLVPIHSHTLAPISCLPISPLLSPSLHDINSPY